MAQSWPAKTLCGLAIPAEPWRRVEVGGEREGPGPLPLPLPPLHPLLPAGPWSRLTPSTEPHLPAATAAASRCPSEPEAWVRGRGTSTHSCSPGRGGHRGPAPHPKPWVRPTLPGDPSPRAGGGRSGASRGGERAQTTGAPQASSLSAQVCRPQGTGAGYCPYSHIPRGAPRLLC